MRRPILLLLPLALLAISSAAGAQRLAFPGIPWGTPTDSARARIEAQGFVLDSALENGDRVFRRADGSWLTAYFREGRAFGITFVDPARRPAVEARFATLADSLQAQLGAPAFRDSVQLWWEEGSGELRLVTRFVRGPQVEIHWRGPGWYDETYRRRRLQEPELPQIPRGFTIVSSTAVSWVSVDTTTLARQADGVLRGRFRIDYAQPVGPDTARYDAAEYEMEYDCAGGRTRLLRRVTWLAGARRGDDAWTRIPWAPPAPGNHYARGLAAVCRAARR